MGGDKKSIICCCNKSQHVKKKPVDSSLSLLRSDSLSLSSRCVRIKCGATKRVRVKARCVMRERDVNFGAFLNFLQTTAQ